MRLRLGLTVLATAIAIAIAMPQGWGHRFPAVRTVVVQVEPCSVALLVGWRPASGDDTAVLLGEAKTGGKDQEVQILTQRLTALALAPIRLRLGGVEVAPTSVEANVTVEDGTGRPVVLLLVSYPASRGGALEIVSKDPKSTRISWVDKSAGRVEIGAAPTQSQWHDDLASFLLNVAVATPTEGTAPCQRSAKSPSPSHSSAPLRASPPVVTKQSPKTTRAIPRLQKSASPRRSVVPSSTK